MLDADLSLVLGLFFCCLAVVSILSALADLRRPWTGALVGLAGMGLVAHAMAIKPGGYAPAEVPLAVYDVIDRLFLD